MTDHVIHGSAYTFGEALIIQRGGDSAVLYCKIIDEPVDLGSVHAGVDMFCHMIQNRRV